jgi:hypothetical protein
MEFFEIKHIPVAIENSDDIICNTETNVNQIYIKEYQAEIEKSLSLER